MQCTTAEARCAGGKRPSAPGKFPNLRGVRRLCARPIGSGRPRCGGQSRRAPAVEPARPRKFPVLSDPAIKAGMTCYAFSHCASANTASLRFLSPIPSHCECRCLSSSPKMDFSIIPMLHDCPISLCSYAAYHPAGMFDNQLAGKHLPADESAAMRAIWLCARHRRLCGVHASTTGTGRGSLRTPATHRGNPEAIARCDARRIDATGAISEARQRFRASGLM